MGLHCLRVAIRLADADCRRAAGRRRGPGSCSFCMEFCGVPESLKSVGKDKEKERRSSGQPKREETRNCKEVGITEPHTLFHNTSVRPAVFACLTFGTRRGRQPHDCHPSCQERSCNLPQTCHKPYTDLLESALQPWNLSLTQSMRTIFHKPFAATHLSRLVAFFLVNLRSAATIGHGSVTS